CTCQSGCEGGTNLHRSKQTVVRTRPLHHPKCTWSMKSWVEDWDQRWTPAKVIYGVTGESQRRGEGPHLRCG
ncbi:hypothetical protein INR49_020668, partial [Caranx melampygus]